MKYLLILILLFPASLFGAECSNDEKKSNTFSLYFENDLFGNTDKGYTNGIKLSWVSHDLTEYAESGRLPKWSLPYVRKLPFINQPELQRNITLSLGQSMYTPEDIECKELIKDDRPYAGWTYFGLAFHSKNYSYLNSLEIQIGIVGPESFAEQTQKLVHRMRDCQRPNGWEHQLKNEPGLAVIYNHMTRILCANSRGIDIDAIAHAGGALGNVYTFADTGMEVRFGLNIPSDFGTSLIRPAGGSDAPVNARDPRITSANDFSLYMFTMINGYVILRNIFLDGNTFTDSHSVDKKYFVGEIGAGIGMVYHRYKLSYAHILRTKEFNHQDSCQVFGSITFSFTY